MFPFPTQGEAVVRITVAVLKSIEKISVSMSVCGRQRIAAYYESGTSPDGIGGAVFQIKVGAASVAGDRVANDRTPPIELRP